MAKERTSVRMQTQIKIISEQGHSIRTIPWMRRLSRRTVRKYFRTGAVVAGEPAVGRSRLIGTTCVRLVPRGPR
jgi:hypothetical protein